MSNATGKKCLRCGGALERGEARAAGSDGMTIAVDSVVVPTLSAWCSSMEFIISGSSEERKKRGLDPIKFRVEGYRCSQCGGLEFFSEQRVY